MLRRLRTLTPSQRKRMEALRQLARLLDSAFEVPGTGGYRVGMDPIVGLVPVIGDLLSPIFTIGLLWQSRDFGIPKVVQLRMLMNVAIDTAIGAVPIVGDLFDFAWKANQRNLALLEAYAYEERPARPGDWIFVVGIIVMLHLIAAAPIVLTVWLARAIFGGG